MSSRPPNPDFQSSSFGRRASDDLDHEPTLRDVYLLQLETRNHLVRIDSAFVRDDLHQPDYGGHRKAHLSMISNADTLEKFKMGVAVKVGAFIAVFFLGLLGSGASEWVKGLAR